jgi:hypothetical protein
MSQRVIDDPAAAGWEFDADTGYWMWKGEEGTGDLWEQNGNNIHYSDGNVGIGTDDPESPLTVAGSETVGIEYVSSGHGYIRASGALSSAFSLADGDGNQQVGISWDATSGTRFTNASSDSFDFRNSTISVLKIDSNGNVGIGTNDPDLDGTRGIHLYASGTTQMVRLQKGNGADFTMKAGSTLAAFQTSTNHPIVFRTNGQNDRMSIGADGRVDITGTLYVNGKKTLLESGKIGYSELITTLVTLRKATMDETQDIRESLRDAIDELVEGFEQEIAAMPEPDPEASTMESPE